MGAVDEYRDAWAREDYSTAFKLAVKILNRKGSKNLMYSWAEECVKCLRALGKLDLLPDNFSQLSAYGRREELNKLTL